MIVTYEVKQIKKTLELELENTFDKYTHIHTHTHTHTHIISKTTLLKTVARVELGGNES
jgi:hypothetical protein